MSHELLDRAKRDGTPLIDHPGGDHVSATFVWRGKAMPQLIGDFNDWGDAGAPIGLSEVEPGLWACEIDLPQDAYIEYCFLANGRRVLDPLNPNTTPNGMGDRNNAVYMPGAAPTPLRHRRRGAPQGVVTHHRIEAGDLAVGSKRSVYLYQPPVAQPCPLMVVLDGSDYLHRARLPVIVDNLIAQGRIQPLAMALVDSSAAARFVEYACSDATVGFLTQIVVPFARDRLNLLDLQQTPGRYGIMGASMGGVMALYAAVRAPEVFGSVLSQSGAFSMPNDDFVIFDLLRQAGVRPLRIWMDSGAYEGLLNCNRRMCELLVSKGYDVTYREYNGAHNYPAWRDDLWRGLENLYGGGR